jgi:hypothetical protein
MVIAIKLVRVKLTSRPLSPFSPFSHLQEPSIADVTGPGGPGGPYLCRTKINYLELALYPNNLSNMNGINRTFVEATFYLN